MITSKDISHSLNGYVVHFLKLLTKKEREAINSDNMHQFYALAVERCKPLGGIMFHCTSYGGGVLFSYCFLAELLSKLNEIVDKLEDPN